MTKALYNFDKIESIFTELYKKSPEENIMITYKIADDSVVFNTNNIEIILYTWWNIKLTHNSIVKLWHFSQVWELLNTLP